MKIDVHAHEFPEPYVREVYRLVERGKFPEPVKPLKPWRIEEHLALLEREGIDLQVLSLATARYDGEDRARARSLAQTVNDSFAEAVAEHPGRLAALAHVPLPFVEDAIEELTRAVKELGLRGVLIGTNVAERPLTRPEFQPFFEAISRMRIPVLLHPMDPGWAAPYREDRLDLWVGWPFDTTLAVGKMILTGWLDVYPDFPLIISHLGGGLHYLCERIEMGLRKGRAKKGARDYLSRFYYDTSGPVPPEAVGCALQMFGAERIVFGSDYPFGPDDGDTYIRRAIASVESQDCSLEEKEAIFSLNARRVLSL